MRTVSLRARVAATGVAVVAIVLLGLDTFVYVSLRERLIGTLEDRLESRTTLARRLGPTLNAPELRSWLAPGCMSRCAAPTGGSWPPSRTKAIPCLPTHRRTS